MKITDLYKDRRCSLLYTNFKIFSEIFQLRIEKILFSDKVSHSSCMRRKTTRCLRRCFHTFVSKLHCGSISVRFRRKCVRISIYCDVFGKPANCDNALCEYVASVWTDNLKAGCFGRFIRSVLNMIINIDVTATFVSSATICFRVFKVGMPNS